MKRITSDNTFEMNMHQLALNQVYIEEDGWAWYQHAPEDELSVCDLIRTAAETLGADLPMLNDDDLSGLMADWLQYGVGEPEGVLAILYRALCAMAEVRAGLSQYEDTGLEPGEIKEVQEALNPIPFGRFRDIMEAERAGRLVVLPCKAGTPVWEIGDFDGGNLKRRPFSVEDMSFWRFGITVFLTREEAEAALKKRGEEDNEAD